LRPERHQGIGSPDVSAVNERARDEVRRSLPPIRRIGFSSGNLCVILH
jgi:hypothetical protein